MQIDLPDVVAEVRSAFDIYEKALVSNDVETLDALFHDDARTIRYGGGENLYGYCRDQGFSLRALARRPRPQHRKDRDHDLWPRFRDRLDLVPPRIVAREDRPADADLGAFR